MIISRSEVRNQFASLLEERLVGVGKPVRAVYSYQIGDFRGQSPVIVVTSTGTNRGSDVVGNESEVFLEAHVFVVYAMRPIQLTSDVDAGTSVVILLEDTSIFEVGMEVTLQDDLAQEVCIVQSIVNDVSITLTQVVGNYTTPMLSIWTESQSEDLIDDLERDIAQLIKDANDEGPWLSIAHNNETGIDVVEISGEAFRHETIPVRVTIVDF